MMEMRIYPSRVINIYKMLAAASVRAGVAKDGRSILGLPVSTTEAKKRRESGAVFIKEWNQWVKAECIIEKWFPIYLRYGKGKYFCILSEQDSIFMQFDAFDRFQECHD